MHMRRYFRATGMSSGVEGGIFGGQPAGTREEEAASRRCGRQRPSGRGPRVRRARRGEAARQGR